MPRARITASDAISIFKLKGPSSSATIVARKYGMSEKAIRDVWKGRTWARETWHLDMARPSHFKQIGRPVGRKDKFPRKKAATLRAVPQSTSRVSPDPVSSFEQSSILSTAARQNLSSPCIQPDLSMGGSSLFQFHSPEYAGILPSLDDVLYDWELNPHMYNRGNPIVEGWDLASAWRDQTREC